MNRPFSTGEIPLHFVLHRLFHTLVDDVPRRDSLELIELLLQFGADTHLLGDELRESVACTDTEVLRLFLKYDARFACLDSGGRPLLYVACEAGDIQNVKLFLDAGADVNGTHQLTGNTALHVAVHRGNAELVHFLLENGARINARSIKGYSPLHVAAFSGNIEICDMLLKKGADLELASISGLTAMDVSVDGGVSAMLRRKQKGRRHFGSVPVATSGSVPSKPRRQSAPSVLTSHATPRNQSMEVIPRLSLKRVRRDRSISTPHMRGRRTSKTLEAQ